MNILLQVFAAVDIYLERVASTPAGNHGSPFIVLFCFQLIIVPYCSDKNKNKLRPSSWIRLPKSTVRDESVKMAISSCSDVDDIQMTELR